MNIKSQILILLIRCRIKLSYSINYLSTKISIVSTVIEACIGFLYNFDCNRIKRNIDDQTHPLSRPTSVFK